MTDNDLNREMTALAKGLRAIASDFVSAASWLENAAEHGVEKVDNSRFLSSVVWALDKILSYEVERVLFWSRSKAVKAELEELMARLTKEAES
jgi:hypothetical protein